MERLERAGLLFAVNGLVPAGLSTCAELALFVQRVLSERGHLPSRVSNAGDPS